MLRRQLPSMITFGSLVCGFSAVVMATHDDLVAAGVLIVVGYLLDGLDGGLARRLGVTSDFGLQLDSLADLITFGMAPSVLVYEYLRQVGQNPLITWIVCTAYLVGGAFRLARFNLLPAKTGSSESMGLTISTSGAAVALSVLANSRYNDRLIPLFVFPLLMVILAVLMMSRVRCPPVTSFRRRWWLSATGLGVAAVLALWLSPQLVGLGLVSGYVCFSLGRAIYTLIL